MDWTHIDDHGNARMVDVSGKQDTVREAIAEALVRMRPGTLSAILDSSLPKGDVLAAARIAGILAAKQTHLLIPLCHALPITGMEVSFAPQPPDALHITAAVRTAYRTGVEMEAMTAASIAALTVYDMCKAVDRGMVIERVRLLQKSGGRSGEYHAGGAEPEQ